jgi:hypothetical protein
VSRKKQSIEHTIAELQKSIKKMLTEAFVVQRPGEGFKLQSIKVEDQLRDNEVLIEVKATGICHTDLNFSKEETIPGLFPGVFGHEGKPACQTMSHIFAASSASRRPTANCHLARLSLHP